METKRSDSKQRIVVAVFTVLEEEFFAETLVEDVDRQLHTA
jgi:hypothetical protein